MGSLELKGEHVFTEESKWHSGKVTHAELTESVFSAEYETPWSDSGGELEAKSANGIYYKGKWKEGIYSGKMTFHHCSNAEFHTFFGKWDEFGSTRNGYWTIFLEEIEGNDAKRKNNPNQAKQ